MTNEEIVALIRSGDKERMLDLWEQNQGIIRREVQKVITQMNAAGNVKAEFDDLVQTSYLALDVAVSYFDPEKGYAFITYFCKVLARSLWESVGFHNDAADIAISLDTPVGDEDGELILSDTVADPEDHIEQLVDALENQELHGAIEEVLSNLDKTHADVIRMRFFFDMSYEEISEQTGIVPSLIKRWLSVPSLRRELKGIYAMKYRAIVEHYIDLKTDYYATGSVLQQTSPVEMLVEQREKERERIYRRMWNGR